MLKSLYHIRRMLLRLNKNIWCPLRTNVT